MRDFERSSEITCLTTLATEKYSKWRVSNRATKKFFDSHSPAPIRSSLHTYIHFRQSRVDIIELPRALSFNHLKQ